MEDQFSAYLYFSWLLWFWSGQECEAVKTTYLIFENFMVITTEAPEPKKNSIQDIPKNNFLRT